MTSTGATRPDAAEQAIEQALARLDLATKVHLLTGSNFWALYPAPEIGLRPLIVSDGPAGVKGGQVNMTETTTSLPSPTALAASWDEGLIGEIGRLLAGEARRKNVDVVLGPTINLHRSPVGGRHFEQFSEDPLLTGRVAVAYVRGLQENGVGACPKHYVCNDSETDRHNYSAEIEERPLHEVYLAPFERAIREAEAWTTMAAYNRVNGTRMTEHPLLTEPLKGRWGWDGLVMSDWFATHSTVPSGRAALDLVMPGPTGPWGDQLLAAVQAGEVPESAIDEKVRRLLRLAARVGALDGVEPYRPVASRLPQDELSALVRRASAAGSVLLKNDGLLPLETGEGGVRRIALLGPNASVEPGQGGGSANLRADYAVTPFDGLRAALPAGVEILTNPADAIRPGLHPVGRGEVTLPAAAGEDAGKPGILVVISDAAGKELAREIRPDGELTWVGNPHLLGKPVVEFTTIVGSAIPGVHRIGFAVRGHSTVWIDGKQVLDETIWPSGTDIDSTWHEPVVHPVDVELGPDRGVEVRIRWEKFYDQSAVFLRLLMEKPTVTFEESMARSEELARAADIAIVLLGSNKEDETEGRDRTTLALARRQDEIVARIAAANPNTAVVLAVGSPVLMPWRDEVGAILLTHFPGQESGNALADMLLGTVEPGGRLTTSWPAVTEDVPVLDTQPIDGKLRYAEGLHVGYRAWLRAGREPAFPFGHGMGYTSWEYVSASVEPGDGGRAVRVRLRNVGPRAGREVVEAYLSRPDSAVERPARWLAGWAAATAGSGEDVEVVVPIDEWALRYWDVSALDGAGDWAVERGAYTVSIGHNVLDLPLEVTLEV